MSRKEALSQFINQIHGRPVVVKLNSGVDYRGKEPAAFLEALRRMLTHDIRNKICPLSTRCSCLSRWLHEHCPGPNRRICQRSIEKQIRRCIHSW